MKAARTARSTRTSSSTACPTRSRRTSRTSTSSAGRRPTTTTRPAGRGRSTRRSRCGSATQLRRRHRRPPDRLVAGGHVAPQGEMRDQYIHAIDIVPTLLECLGVELPEVVKGYTQIPIQGVSFRLRFADAERRRRKETQFYLDARHARHLAQGLEGATVTPGAPRAWGISTEQQWELFDTVNPPERVPLRRRQRTRSAPAARRALVGTRPGKYQALPLDSATRSGILDSRSDPNSPSRAPLRLLPRLRRSAGVGAAEHPQSLATPSGPSSRIDDPKASRRALRAGRPVRWPCPLPERTACSSTSTTSPASPSRWSNRPSRCRSATSCLSALLRQGRRRHADRRARSRCYIPDEPSAGPQDQNPTRQVLPRR